jgi:hypothetical protein
MWLDNGMETTSDTAVTYSTKVSELMAGDIVFRADGDVEVETVFNDPGFGSWVYFTNGERESFPVGFKVYRVVEV